MEAAALKLTADNFPLPCPLQDLIDERFGGTRAADAPLMDRRDLVARLREADDTSLAPFDAGLLRSGAKGEPELPSDSDLALLRWVGEALAYWRRQFPIAEPLAGELRRLTPLLSALAVSDPAFLIPGRHPVHRLLDSIQQAAVGWQPELGRGAQPMQQLVVDAVHHLLEWFDSEEIDLARICDRAIAMIERDMQRATRMGQRTEDVERGHLRQLQAGRQAATMINELLAQQDLPEKVGGFLKGPWFDSAQLVLLKFGKDSAQWQSMCNVTAALLESLRDEALDERERQQLFDVVTRLPRELKRWLLSLQHDTPALESALGSVQDAHLRILRRQPLQTVAIEPIELPEPAPVHRAIQEILSGLEVGRWYLVASGAGEPLRARLALRMEEDRSLLFTNFSGARALRPGFADFSALLAEGRVRPLDCGCAFSRSLAWAAGIESVEELEEMTGAMTGIARQEAELQEHREAAPDRRPAGEAAGPERRPGRAESAGSGAATTLQKLPMGAWLGFHDGEMPLLARLAVHDRQSDTYIFVNRMGIRLRELQGDELAALIQRGDAEILEMRGSFREAVNRLRDGHDSRPADDGGTGE